MPIRRTFLLPVVLAVLVLVGLAPSEVSAHVKWFTDFSFLDRPQTFVQSLSPLVIGFTVFSAIAVTATVFIDNRLEKLQPYVRLRDWLTGYRDQGTLILRVGMGATLLLSWQADTLLAPYLQADPWLGWAQFVLVLLLLFPQTTPIAGAGVIVLWVIGVFSYGTFYMLDYLSFVGIGIWLLLSRAESQRVRELGIPALYFTVGFALSWLAMEKIVYPEWGFDILEQNPQLALGFPFEFFVVGAAFVEFTLGYLLIIGLLGRPLSLVITLVFFTTTLVFGKVEVIGHTHLHAALLVFLLYGPGNHYPAPIDIHKRISWRMAFAAVNYVILFGIFLFIFTFGAGLSFDHAVAEALTPEQIEQCEALGATGEIRIEGAILSCETVLQASGR